MDEVKTMNLINDQWLPIREKKGGERIIRISELGGDTGKSLLEVLPPRADFKGAIYQLLIGILQTAFAPKDSREWKKYWRNPPSQAELEQAFKRIEPAFNLNAENGTPAFMQDLDLPYEKKDVPVGKILIEAPGENTVKNNIDHFIKRNFVNCISSYWAAVAIFTLQINGPPSGGGHKAGLRGSGQLTTLLVPQGEGRIASLWERVWINVLTKEEIAELNGNHSLADLENIFPWMIKTRTSEKPGMETYPVHTNPLQMYWPMPRRIRLHWQQTAMRCGLTGQQSSVQVYNYHTKPRGTKYEGNWVHPLSPYMYETGETPNPIKLKHGGVGYRHWLGLAIAEPLGTDKRIASAKIVDVYRARFLKSFFQDDSFYPQIWAFGYEMEKESAVCWHEAIMPIFNLEGDALADLQDYAQKMVSAATDVLQTLKLALKNAWFKEPKDERKKKQEQRNFNSKSIFIDANFWSATEAEFYRLLAELAELTEKNDEDGVKKLLSVWAVELKQSARTLFDQYALSSLNEDGDYKQVIKAKHGKGGLEHYLNGSKALKDLAA